ncbi:MAG: hypothetical protein H0X45_04685 [Planctomycetes bacterium]|nr:hypothetical protein [Planctomycetota bacterium]
MHGRDHRPQARGDHGHLHHDGFESFGELLMLSAPYLVVVDQRAPGIDGGNALPWCRLFILPPGAAKREASVTLDGPPRQVMPLRPGTATFMPAGAPLHFRFPTGLRMLACHFRLEWAPGVDACDGIRRLVQADAGALGAAAAATAAGPGDAGAVMRICPVWPVCPPSRRTA